MSRLSRRAFLGAALALTLPLPLRAQSQSPRSLFIGHSFFVPIARTFDAIAQTAGLPGHHADFVFAGGRNGMPRQLWNDLDRRAQIEARLAQGDVQLFAMPGGSSTSYPSDAEDYANWIALALSHNPGTQVFISQVWLPNPWDLGARDYGRAIAGSARATHAMVETLRTRFPGTTITFGNHGIIAAAMRAGFEQNRLPGVTARIGDRPGTLFRDEFGHAGQMMLHVMGLYWATRLTGARLSDLPMGGYDPEATATLLSIAGRLDTRFP